MPIVYRPAREQDLAPAQELVVRSVNDLTERHGFGPMASLRPTLFQSFSLKDDPDGLWVAEDAGEILGFAFSWVCGDLWFLAELFVSPDHQGRGIGQELLKRTSDHAQKNGAIHRALITFTFNTVSQGLYIRHGMFPRLPLHNFNVTREVLLKRLPEAQLRHAPLEDTASHLQSLAHIDAQTLGVSRAKHHRHLINESGLNGVAFTPGTIASATPTFLRAVISARWALLSRSSSALHSRPHCIWLHIAAARTYRRSFPAPATPPFASPLNTGCVLRFRWCWYRRTTLEIGRSICPATRASCNRGVSARGAYRSG